MLKTIIDDCGFNITKKNKHTRGCWCDGEPLVTNDEYFEKGSKFRFFFQEILLLWQTLLILQNILHFFGSFLYYYFMIWPL